MSHYNKHDHTHCFDQKDPPCGIQGTHRCCLCTEPVPHLQTQEKMREKFRKFSLFMANAVEAGDVGYKDVESAIADFWLKKIFERDTALVELMRKEVNEKYKEWHELLGKAEHEEKSSIVKICNERMNAYLDVMSLLSAHLQDIK